MSPINNLTLSTIEATSPSPNLLDGLNDTLFPPGSEPEELQKNDAAWALSCAFLILTMQTGFAMLECGNVSAKNAASIMIKNCVDVTFGGLSYWCFGYGLTFGRDYPNPFCGIGHWFFSGHTGTETSHYFFHFSFASTATTIVSGAVAERMNFYAYIVFSLYNTIVYCIPASWAWNTGHGWLDGIGFFDFAGTCIVHYGGGVSALVAAKMVGPRIGRFEKPDAYRMSSPVTSLTGMFMLWWAWMSFNAGSTFGVNGNLWKVSALAAVNTLNGGIAGALVGISVSMYVGKGKVFINETVNSILGGLVAVTGICAITEPSWALFIGGVGGLCACLGQYLMERIRIDDPVGAVPVHLMAACWGTLAVGLFSHDLTGKFPGKRGLFQGGGFRQLYVQVIGLAAVTVWSGLTTALGMKILDLTIGIRASLDDEILGADWTHHAIQTGEWANDLFDDVLEKLSGAHVDEKTASQVLQELKAQLLQLQRSRGNSPKSSPSSSIAEPFVNPPQPQLSTLDSDPTPPGGTTENSTPHLRPEVPSDGLSARSKDSTKSRRELLNDVIEVASHRAPARSYWRKINGPLNMPLYKAYAVRRPRTPAGKPPHDLSSTSDLSQEGTKSPKVHHD